MGRRIVFLTWATVLVLMLSVLAPSVSMAGQKENDHEVELGKEAAVQAEKDLKFVKDAALQKRVDTIGQEIAAIAKVTPVKAMYGNADLANFNYVFKIVDDKDVNAFSLPGGFIYVNKGLIDRVESDDELAGVLAHEIAHAAHHHMAALLKKEAKLNTNMLVVAAVAILAGGSGADTSNLLLGAQLVSIAKLNSYGQVAERDADNAAVAYMVKTKYNPVGILTFMEKLARDETYRQENLGIFATHPPSAERAEALIAELNRRKIPINRRAVSKTLEVTTKDVETKGEKACQILISGQPVFTAAPAGGKSAKDRVDVMVKALNTVLDENPTSRDVKVDSDYRNVLIKNQAVIDITSEDADLAGVTVKELATQTHQKVNRILYDTWLKQLYW